MRSLQMNYIWLLCDQILTFGEKIIHGFVF